MSREEEIIAALVALGKAKAKIDLNSLQGWVSKLPDASGAFPNESLDETNWKITARQVVRTLKGLGLVQTKGYKSIQPTSSLLNSSQLSESVLAAIANRPQDPSSETPTPGDKGSGNGTPPNGGDQDEPNGKGFREVLGHPYLFSLPEDEFDELLNSIQ